jgi:hypothetical protein
MHRQRTWKAGSRAVRMGAGAPPSLRNYSSLCQIIFLCGLLEDPDPTRLGTLPATKLLSESTLSLPFFRDLRQQDIDRVVGVRCRADRLRRGRLRRPSMPAVEIGAEPIVYRNPLR